MDGGADANRYEQLRRSALCGDAAGCRLGLAVLERSGVAVWMRTWRSTGPAAEEITARSVIPAAGDELVGVLAAMAHACLGSR